MASISLPYLVFGKMLYIHLIVLSLSYIAAANPVTPSYNPHNVQYELQIVPVSPQPVGQPTQYSPYYLSAQQPQQVIIPIANAEKQPGNHHTQQFAVLNRVDANSHKSDLSAPLPVQVGLQTAEQYPHRVTGYHAPQPSEELLYQPYHPSTQQPFLPVLPDPQFPVHQPPHFGVHPQPPSHVHHQPTVHPTYHPDTTNHYFHSPPPAPHGSNSAYTATLSYGPGHPTIVYNCYIPGRHPHPTTRDGHIVKGSNGYHCIVSSYSDNNHVINLHSNTQTIEPIKSSIFNDPETKSSEHSIEETNK